MRKLNRTYVCISGRRREPLWQMQTKAEKFERTYRDIRRSAIGIALHATGISAVVRLEPRPRLSRSERHLARLSYRTSGDAIPPTHQRHSGSSFTRVAISAFPTRYWFSPTYDDAHTPVMAASNLGCAAGAQSAVDAPPLKGWRYERSH